MFSKKIILISLLVLLIQLLSVKKGKRIMGKEGLFWEGNFLERNFIPFINWKDFNKLLNIFQRLKGIWLKFPFIGLAGI